MDRALPLFAIGLIFGGGIGFAVAASNGVTLDGHDHADPAQHGSAQHGAAMGSMAHHDHETPLVLPADVPAPSVALTVQPDPATGWNLHMATENFTFAPENASLAHVPGQGHAHIYVNGTKIGRFYGPWAHLATLPEGEVTIRATLNANDHRPLAVGDRPVEDSVTLTR
jgi:hypothetical protein